MHNHLAASDITSEQQQKNLKVPILWKESKITKSECVNHFWEKKNGVWICFVLFFCVFKKRNSLAGAGSRQKQDSQAHKVEIGPI